MLVGPTTQCGWGESSIDHFVIETQGAKDSEKNYCHSFSVNGEVDRVYKLFGAMSQVDSSEIVPSSPQLHLW
jgi:hypothetical protein